MMFENEQTIIQKILTIKAGPDGFDKKTKEVLLLDYKTGYTMKYQQQLEEYQTAK
jgi:hypothetical protein